MGKARTIEEINQKIMDGTALVMTAQELCAFTQKGKKITFDDVDVVTTATKGIMSGTSCIMALRVAEPRKYLKFKSLSMNDIPCYVGPCPNEYLGLIDLIIYATDVSLTNPNYGAGHLLRDLVEKKSVHIKAHSVEETDIEKDVTLDDIYFAQVMGIRHAFKNYNAFLNPNDFVVNKSIFTVIPMQPGEKEISFCGCGVVNPLENDPEFDVLGIGSPVLVNGSIGYIIGSGTRSSPSRPNLMTIASLFDMKPKYMGGFVTSNGPEVICSIAAAIPIINERVFNHLKMLDQNVPLNICDIVGRKVLETQDYGQVWKENNFVVNVTPFYKKKICSKCEHNHHCPVEKMCPTNAFTMDKGIDESKCFNCGTCIRICSQKAFFGDLGELAYTSKKVPVKLRQSDRNGAIQLMDELKDLILKGKYPIVLPTAKPVIYTEKTEVKHDSHT
jgi:putative methanogenesis marker 16 metalloprotein